MCPVFTLQDKANGITQMLQTSIKLPQPGDPTLIRITQGGHLLLLTILVGGMSGRSIARVIQLRAIKNRIE